jgi:hypothetical protein
VVYPKECIAVVIEAEESGAGGGIVLLGGRIHSNIGKCSFYETFENEWSSYFLIWAATNITLICVFYLFKLYLLYHELWPVSWFISSTRQQSKKQKRAEQGGV